MKGLATIGLLLALALVMVSAYLRLENSGIGCLDWPDCYARIGLSQPDQATDPHEIYQRLADETTSAVSWATPLHRLVASLLGLCTLGLALTALIKKKHRVISSALLALTVFLALLGIRSGGLHDPAIVMGNLAGGFLMVALLGWLVFVQRPSTLPAASAATRRLAVAALSLCALLAALGGLTSANFAATACPTIPDCNGSYLPGADLWRALDLSLEHAVDSDGFVIGGGERASIQKLHRIAALFALLAVLLAVTRAWRERSEFRAIATTIAILFGGEFAVGIAAVVTDLPIFIAVAHNWLAALLLLSLLRLLSLMSGQERR